MFNSIQQGQGGLKPWKQPGFVVRVKICGNRSVDDVKLAVKHGADAIGLIVGVTHFSEDAIEPSEAAKLITHIPIFVNSVLVTHLSTTKEILDIHSEVRSTAIQLQDFKNIGELDKLRLSTPGVQIIKAVHVINMSSVTEALEMQSHVDAILLDTLALDEDRIGGTGRVHDWSISKEIISKVSIPVILAGGLDSANIVPAIEYTRPFGVDVNSGVDDGHGNKISREVKAFISNAKKTVQY